MGRPKGSKNKPKENQIVAEPVVVCEVKPQPQSKPIKVVCLCDCCKAEIYSSPVSVNLCALTGKATWHRNIETDRVSLCDKCAKELNDVIDKWLINHGCKEKMQHQ